MFSNARRYFDLSTAFSRLPDRESSNPSIQYNTRYCISFVKFSIKFSKRLFFYEEIKAAVGSWHCPLPIGFVHYFLRLTPDCSDSIFIKSSGYRFSAPPFPPLPVNTTGGTAVEFAHALFASTQALSFASSELLAAALAFFA